MWVSFDGKNCAGCTHLNARGYCEFTACIIPCVVSASVPEIRSKTNADRIRAMSDEELAKSIAEAICSGVKAVFPLADYSDADISELSADWLEWLKKEVDND